jgi:hypothetical protein
VRFSCVESKTKDSGNARYTGEVMFGSAIKMSALGKKQTHEPQQKERVEAVSTRPPSPPKLAALVKGCRYPCGGPNFL